MPSSRAYTRLVYFIISATLLSCNTTPENTIILPSYFRLHWEDLPHRISQLELSADFEGPQTVLTTQNDGGDFGEFDSPSATYRYTTNVHGATEQLNGNVTLLVAPAENHSSPDAFFAETTVRVSAAELGSPNNVAALIRGFRIDTDLYESPPAFATKEELPYSPNLGFTTSGLGIWLTQPRLVGDQWEFVVQVRNRLGLGDRPDMNEAILEAFSWVRVDYSLIGTPKAITIERAEKAYKRSFQEFGANTVHPEPTQEEQLVEFSPLPGTHVVGYGLSGFDITVNVPGKYESANCTPEHEELNAWGQPIGGPGRYVRTLTAGVHSVEHSTDTGKTNAQLKVHFSNSSILREIGNLCLGVKGVATLLRSELSSTQQYREKIHDLEYKSGEFYRITL